MAGSKGSTGGPGEGQTEGHSALAAETEARVLVGASRAFPADPSYADDLELPHFTPGRSVLPGTDVCLLSGPRSDPVAFRVESKCSYIVMHECLTDMMRGQDAPMFPHPTVWRFLYFMFFC